MTVARCSYYRFPLPKGWVAERERRFGLHGGQVETSLMLHIAPHLVRPLHLVIPVRRTSSLITVAASSAAGMSRSVPP